MSRMWIAAGPNGKVQVLLGAAAVRERRKVGREIDATMLRAVTSGLDDGEIEQLERLAAIADRLARSG
jgi:hypothetical protein